MSTHVFKRSLQNVYPASIFAAVLACAGMSLVQAGGTESKQLFPDDRDTEIFRNPATAEIQECSAGDGKLNANNSRSCSNEGLMPLMLEFEGANPVTSQRTIRRDGENL